MTQFASSLGTRYVLIEHVGDGWVNCYDYRNGSAVDVPLGAPGGLMPRVGDVWAIARDGSSRWGLQGCVSLAVPERTASLGTVLRQLTERGLIHWDPDSGPHPTGKSMHGSEEIGSFKLFASVQTPDGYLPADGSTSLPIPRWRRLFRIYGVSYGGNGITTFGVPSVPTGNASVKWMICAE